jgi:DNA-directed RNA polymerase specialized sigma24 family protein
MPDPTDDPELLRRYAEEKSEAAFAELVRRHLPFVYAGAHRRVGGDPHLAETAAVQVFTWLAREALTLEGQPLLTGWLYARTRTASEAAVRAERRRTRRESAAGAGEASGDGSRTGPVIDEAIEQLSELDRESVMLRVLRQAPWEEVAARLSLTETAARMRVERSIGRLQAALADRGFALTPAAVEQLLARLTAAVPPPALVPKIINAALEAAAMVLAGRGVAGPRRSPWLLLGAGAVAVVAIAVAAYEHGQAEAARDRVEAAEHQVRAVSAEARGLRERLQAELRRTQAADEDNARLLEAVSSIAANSGETAAPTSEAVTADALRSRFKHAGELVRARRYAEALQDYLWCYDGMGRLGSLRGLRRGLVTRAIADLGRSYPAALQALRERRDVAQAALRASADDHDAASDFAELNDALNEGARSVAEFDSLPENDPRRAVLAARITDVLAEAGRYGEAVRARPYWQMNSEFETLVASAGASSAGALRQELHDGIVHSAATDVELLAGDGDVAHARALARRLLAFDDSDETRALLAQRLSRAGHPEVLDGLARR